MPAAADTLHAATPLVALGFTRVAPSSALWRSPNHTAPVRVLTFPRRAFAVTPERRDRHVLRPGTVALTATSRPYTRTAIDPRGELTDWLWLAPDVLDSLERDGGAWDTSQRWQRPLDGPQLLAQRVLARRARDGAPGSELEERALTLVASLFASSSHGDATPRRAVLRVVEHLVAHHGVTPPLSDLARIAGLSPSHLCVVFKQSTGVTIHAWSRRLRLAAALEALEGSQHPRLRLLDVALAHGFDGHSHFSARFRSHFGCTPSEAQRRLAGIEIP